MSGEEAQNKEKQLENSGKNTGDTGEAEGLLGMIQQQG